MLKYQYLDHGRTDWPAALPRGEDHAGGERGGGGEGGAWSPRQGPAGHAVAVSRSSQAPTKVVGGANS